ncbi:O-antigen polymerase [Pedobacter africanus]|uniref:O-antigen ligase n=1 Tax=Pedobacter africanus TaxID=151894 RepID=A0ACC6KVN8_9SPHI|nr:O-antigen ligase family protein [Pedobacter africanus]MDR6783225.1 O-antigen ligase [Pedobacter africanus]
MLLKLFKLRFDAGMIEKLTDICNKFIFTTIVVLVPLVEDLISPDVRPRNINNNLGLVVFLYLVTILAVLCTTQLIFRKTATKVNIKAVDLIVLATVIFIVASRSLIALTMFSSFNLLQIAYLTVLYVICRLTISPSIVLKSIVISGILQALYAILQQYQILPSHHELYRTTGSFGNPSILGQYLVSSIIILIPLLHYINKSNIHNIAFYESLQERAKRPTKYILMAIVVLLIIVLVLTRARAALVSLALSVLIFFYREIKQVLWDNKRIFRRMLIAVLFFAVIMSTVFALYRFKKDSADGRLLIWKVCGNMILRKPLMGVGFDNLQSAYMTEQAKYFSTVRSAKELMLADQISYSFNDFIQIIVENGFIGAVLALVLVLSILKTKSETIQEKNLQILKIIVISGLIGAFFSYPSQILPIKIIFVAIVATIVNLEKKSVYKFQINGLPAFPGYKRLLILICVCLLAIISFNNINKLYDGLKGWNKAYLYSRSNDYPMAVEEYDLQYDIFYENGNFLLDYGTALVLSGDYKKALKILEEALPYCNDVNLQMNIGLANYYLKQFKTAELAFANASNMLPNRVLPKYRLATIYVRTRQYVKAQKIAKVILDQPVKIKSKITDSVRHVMEILINSPEKFHTP